MGLDAFAAGGLVELEIGLGLVGEDTEDRCVARGFRVRERLRMTASAPYMPPLADDVEDDHEGPFGRWSLRLRMAQSLA